LTLRRQVDDPTASEVAEANQHLSWSFNRFRTKLKERCGELAYIWTREHTDARWPHLHLLSNVALSPSELSAMWYEASGDSWIVDAQEVDSARAASYLAKYCAAEATSELRPRGARAFSKSRNVTFCPFRRPAAPESHWVPVPVPFWVAVRNARASGATLKVVRIAGTPFADFDAAADFTLVDRDRIWHELATDPRGAIHNIERLAAGLQPLQNTG
jgi:hypothetical protein